MDDKTPSQGESLRESAKTDNRGKDGQIGHGAERDRTPVTRQPRGGSEGDDTRQTQTAPVRGVPGNTSETNAGSPAADIGSGTTRTKSRLPLGPGAGCMRPSGTMFIATVSLVAIAMKLRC